MQDRQSDKETDRLSRRPDGPPLGLDPVSPTRFGEIIDADRDGHIYDSPPEPGPLPRRDQFSRATWVMIVIAGVFLGIAMAMIAAG
ncbi:MAG TPA: hypothetical protein VFV70_02105 [Hyphomonadaceae bacterium]|nr:hypothetical protein [Hyphomonadaceae bacterium]